MLRYLFLLITLAVAALLIYVALQPSDFRVERSADIAAPPAAVYAHVDDFHKWEAWSPWAKRDPNAKAMFEGPAAGEGAKFLWSGNKEVGEGSMIIRKSKPAEHLDIGLAFTKPFEGERDVAFNFKPEGQGTRVTWSLSGSQGFVERLFCTLMRLDMDRMIGADYEQGLAALKSVVEAKPSG